MLPAHAATLAQARSNLAALADRAQTFDAAVAYERVLLQLDHLHGDPMPGISPAPAQPRHELYNLAHAAIGQLAEHSGDLLTQELLLDMLQEARSKDAP